MDGLWSFNVFQSKNSNSREGVWAMLQGSRKIRHSIASARNGCILILLYSLANVSQGSAGVRVLLSAKQELIVKSVGRLLSSVLVESLTHFIHAVPWWPVIPPYNVRWRKCCRWVPRAIELPPSGKRILAFCRGQRRLRSRPALACVLIDEAAIHHVELEPHRLDGPWRRKWR